MESAGQEVLAVWRVEGLMRVLWGAALHEEVVKGPPVEHGASEKIFMS